MFGGPDRVDVGVAAGLHRQRSFSRGDRAPGEAAPLRIVPRFIRRHVADRVRRDLLEGDAAKHDAVGLLAGQLDQRRPGWMREDIERVGIARVLVQPVEFIERDGRPINRFALQRGHQPFTGSHRG